LLVPDSGAPTVVVFERKGRTAVPVEYLDQPVGVSAIALRTVGRGGLLRELKVGALTVHNLPVVVVEGTGPNTIEGDGLLPLHRFSSVSFNNQEGWMSVRR
jgi:hypothetical protein